MISANTKLKIAQYMSQYPQKESALMPALWLVQKDNNNILTKENIEAVAKIVGVSYAKAFGVATFYTMYNVAKPIGKYFLQVDTNIPATLMGARKILIHLEKRLGIQAGQTTSDGLFTLTEVECLASCGTCPVIQVNDIYYENMTPKKVDALLDSLQKGIMPKNKTKYYWGTSCNVLMKNRKLKNATAIKVYKKNGGYQALAKARTMTIADIFATVKQSGLKGRGGAGFPTGKKWEFVPKDTAKPTYLICNADEGEPGTFKDRQIMEYDPHLLIEGMIIAALALGAKLGFIYIRGEFGWIADILEQAIGDARNDGQLKDFNIIVHCGAGAYICGEETALIESIEGKRGQPRMKPPFPAAFGLYGCPTVINNVETLASIPFIIEKGVDEFKKFGTQESTGFKIYGISGNVNKPGCYEFPMGVAFDKLIAAAGGIKGKLKAAIVGGLSTPILTAAELQDLKMDYVSCKEHGTSLGSGGIMVINDEWSIPALTLRTMKFYAHESCGKCTPCKTGSKMIVIALERIVSGQGTKQDLDNVLNLVNTIKGLTLCPLGDAFSVSIKAMIEKFYDEFAILLRA